MPRGKVKRNKAVPLLAVLVVAGFAMAMWSMAILLGIVSPFQG